MNDLLNRTVLQNACPRLAAKQIFYTPACPSTNTLAKEWILAGGQGTALFVAGSQSAGRGRLGRSFYSPAESGVYLTVAWANGIPLPAAGVTCAAAVAVLRAIRSTCGVTCQIKWVNDLLLGGKKVCGILAEGVVQGHQTATAIGVGVNLRPAVFPPELQGIAGSLENQTLPRAALIAAIAENLTALFRTPAPGEWLEEYRNHSCVIGKRVVFSQNGTQTSGQALAVEADGGLRVLTDTGEQILRGGEITLRMDA